MTRLTWKMASVVSAVRMRADQRRKPIPPRPVDAGVDAREPPWRPSPIPIPIYARLISESRDQRASAPLPTNVRARRDSTERPPRSFGGKLVPVRLACHRLAIALLLGLSLSLTLSGCLRPAPLRVGINPWIGYETLPLAAQLGWLPEGVELHATASFSASAQALAEGTLDAAGLTLEEMLLARARGTPLSAVLVFDVSAGADMLLARAEVPSIANLRGRRVGFESSALGPLVLSRALATVDLTLADVERQLIPPEEQFAAWQEGRVDAVVTYGPVATRLERAGARRLFDSRQMPNAIFDVLAVRRERLDHPALPGLVEAHFRALAHLEHNRDDALYRIAHRQQTTFAEVREALAGITLPDLTGNRDLLRAQGPLYQVAADLSGLLVAEGLLAAPADLGGLTEERFVQSLRMTAP